MITNKQLTKKVKSYNNTSNTISIIQKDTIWSPNYFTLFVVSKTTRKHGKNWIHYYLKNNPKQKYYCYEEAFLYRFNQLTN